MMTTRCSCAVAVRTMHWTLLVGLLVHVSVARYHHHHDVHQQQQLYMTTSPSPLPLPTAANSALDNVLVVDEKTGIQYNPYSKHYPGRHVCTVHKQVHCKPSSHTKYRQRNARLTVYQTTYRDVATTNQVMYVCCPGWTQFNNRSHGCNKPKCTTLCQNGGSCAKPDVCICPKGFAGRHCEFDVDECKEHKPCDQICYNTPGSYRCQCRENFMLQPDGQSCRKEGEGETALEAKDLEFELLDKRLLKLETLMGSSHGGNEASKKEFDSVYSNLNKLSKEVAVIRNKIYDMENYKNDMYFLKNKLNQIERKANKVDELVLKYEKMKRCAYNNQICY